MRPRVDPTPKLLALATVQDGVVTREQCLGHGLTPRVITRFLAQGQWSSIARGVYFAAASTPDWRAHAWAGVLLGGEGARIGGLAAAYLHGLADEAPSQILVLTPVQARHRSRGNWLFRRERPGARGHQTRGNPPRITVEDTVLDLCDPRQDWLGESAAHWVTRAVQRHLTTPRRLLRALDGRRLAPQRKLLTALLSEVGEGSQSVLELRYASDVERAHGLPRGVRQARRNTASIERTTAADRDVFYPEYGLVVELDGRLGHVDEGRMRDLRRDNVTTLRGERTLRYGWLDVTDEPCLTARQVADGLRMGGWSGLITPCPRCRLVPDGVVDSL